MGGAGVACGKGPQAMVWNPAATSELHDFAAHVGYCAWFLGTHQQSAFVTRELQGVRAGLGVSSFAAGQFEWRNDVPTEDPAATFEPADITAYLNAALPIGRAVAIGASGRFYYSRICSYSASGYGADMGLRIQPLTSLVLGASVTDFGTALTYEREKASLPTRGRLGAAWAGRVFDQRVVLAADGSYYFYLSAFTFQTGVELELFQLLSLRGGCDISAGGVRPTFGLGLRRGKAGIDYSLQALGYDLGAAHRLSFSLGG